MRSVVEKNTFKEISASVVMGEGEKERAKSHGVHKEAAQSTVDYFFIFVHFPYSIH